MLSMPSMPDYRSEYEASPEDDEFEDSDEEDDIEITLPERNNAPIGFGRDQDPAPGHLKQTPMSNESFAVMANPLISRLPTQRFVL
ncbi:hypothetical protein TRVA0_003S00254 [Trichomonascus vanleenenianus]|uniref:uncharacterized protein n=1 Tax=Trichomonascus vanleenenianus TaxID=2268995 RepID=UPI003EC9D1D3